MILKLIIKKIEAKLRYFAHWRCLEKVIVIDSDDWGLFRKSNSSLLNKYGSSKIWGFEETETENDLVDLNETLKHFKDKHDRPCCFTAYFIVGNPDYTKIKSNEYSQYFDISIETLTDLKKVWKSLFDSRTFFPQYHGRSHQNSYKWLQHLKEDLHHSREFFDKENSSGLSLNKGMGALYLSEYYDCTNPKLQTIPHLSEWVQKGMEFFQNTFGYKAKVTTAPHYYYTSEVSATWKQQGIEYIQGNNYHLIKNLNHNEVAISHALGEFNHQGLLLLGRNINFEPSGKSPSRSLRACLKQANTLLENHIPVIIDTHRINYTGVFKKESLSQLKIFLKSISSSSTIYLTSLELGEAIKNNGKYTDPWNGEVHHLTPRDNILRKLVRKSFTKLNQNRLKKFSQPFN